SRSWNGRLNVSQITLAASVNSMPVWRRAPVPLTGPAFGWPASVLTGCHLLAASGASCSALPLLRSLALAVLAGPFPGVALARRPAGLAALERRGGRSAGWR